MHLVPRPLAQDEQVSGAFDLLKKGIGSKAEEVGGWREEEAEVCGGLETSPLLHFFPAR